ncbi:hypothetical protein M569_13761, partial [Genlisea aurea]
RNVYSVWAFPPADVSARLKKLMQGLRSEFGGPTFDPHVTVVGAITLTETEALDLFNRASAGLKPYTAAVEGVSSGNFFYQCVFLKVNPSQEVLDASSHCCDVFGYQNSSPYMPHLSLLYGDLSEEAKKSAQTKAYEIDDTINSLNFQIQSIALYKTDTEDKSCESWERV